MSSVDEIGEELRFINLKLDQFSDQLDNSSENISKIKDALYHPDTGLYARIRSNDELARKLHAWSEEHEKHDENLAERCKNLSETMTPLVDDYKHRMSLKKWTDKVVWFMIASILGVLVPTAWRVLTAPPPAPMEHSSK